MYTTCNGGACGACDDLIFDIFFFFSFSQLGLNTVHMMHVLSRLILSFAKFLFFSILVRCRNNAGETPLYHALINGHFEVACFLLRHGADALDMTETANAKRRPTETGVASNHRRRPPQSGTGDAGINGRRRGANQTGSRATTRRTGERTPRGAMPRLRRASREEEEEEEEERGEEEREEEEESVRGTGGRFRSESQSPSASPLIAAVEESLNFNFFKVCDRLKEPREIPM